MNEDLIYAGTIVRTRGFRGQMFVTENSEAVQNIREGAKVEIGYSRNFSNSYEIERWDWSKAKALIKIRGIETNEDARHFIEMGVFVKRADIILEDDSQYIDEEVYDCEVYDEEGNYIGKIIEIWDMPVNDVWLVDTENGDVPVPVIDDIIKDVDIENKKIIIHLIDGLMELSNNRENGDED